MKHFDITAFQRAVLGHYRQHGRHELPWRLPEPAGHFDPYKILVSELMLQQTQVSRVVPKFQAFVAARPSFAALADESLSEVLALWNGLGYNRRAKFLWQTARQVTDEHHGILPQTSAELLALPGIGPNTAGAILAYAFNQPVVFIETNIRTVFIHHFFADQAQVADAALKPLIRQALPHNQPRTWYWALMDYGTHLKQTVGNLSRASTAYAKQSRFEGSRRQIRGAVLRLLIGGPLTLADLHVHIQDSRLRSVLHDLAQEGFIAQTKQQYRLCT